MHRRIIWVAIALSAVLAAGLAGFFLAFHVAPEQARQRAEKSLAAILRCPVRVEEARLQILGGLMIVANQVSACPAEASSEDPTQNPALQAKQLRAEVDTLSLLLQKPELEALALVEPTLHLERAHDGTWNLPLLQPQALTEAPDISDGKPKEQDLLADIEAGARAVAAVLLYQKWSHTDLEIENAQISFLDRAPFAKNEAAFAMQLQNFSARYHRGRFFRAAKFEARGNLARTDLQTSEFRITGEQNVFENVALKLELLDFDLLLLAPYVTRRHPDLVPGGHVRGMIELFRDETTPWSLAIDLASEDFQTQPLREQHEASRPDPIHIELQTKVSASGAQIAIEDARLAFDDLIVRGTGAVRRPLGWGTEANLDLAFQDLSLGKFKTILQWAPPELQQRVDPWLAPVEAAFLPSFKLHLESPLRFLTKDKKFDPKPLLEKLEASVTLVDTKMRIENGLLTIHRGEIRGNKDQLEIRDGRFSVDGKHGPILDVKIDGYPLLLASQKLTHPLLQDVAPLPGILLPGEIFHDPGEPISEWELTIDMDQLSHPWFLWPMEDLRLLIYRHAKGQHYAIDQGIWGNAVVRGTGEYTIGNPPKLQIQLQARPSTAAARAVAQGDPVWSHGRWKMHYPKEPKNPLQTLAGRYTLQYTNARLFDVQAPIGEAGLLTGNAIFEAGDPTQLPMDFHFQITKSELPDVTKILGFDGASVIGKVDATGHLVGSFHLGQPRLADLQGQCMATGSNGEINRQLPVLFALARLTDTLNPFKSRETIPFKTIETKLHLDDGMLRVKSFELSGPEIRIIATGTIDLSADEHPTQLIIGTFFFRFVDQIVKLLPWIGKKLMGKDQGIFGLYFAVDGPWDEQVARVTTLETLEKGPASIFFEAIPDALRSAVDLTREASSAPNAAPTAPETPESTAPQPPNS